MPRITSRPSGLTAIAMSYVEVEGSGVFARIGAQHRARKVGIWSVRADAIRASHTPAPRERCDDDDGWDEYQSDEPLVLVGDDE